MKKHQASSTSMPAAPGAEINVADEQGEFINYDEVAEYSGSEPAEMRRFIFRFIASAREDVARIDAALERKDLAEISATAHRMLTPALMVGARSFAELCRALEQGNEGGVEQAREIASRLNPLLERIERQVRGKLG